MERPVNKIAAEIFTIFKEQKAAGSKAAYLVHSWPYLEAMLEMSTFSEMYGMEYGDMVGLYFLNNVQNWRGDDARRLKAELNDLLKKAIHVNYPG